MATGRPVINPEAFYDLEPGDWRLIAEPEGYYPLDSSESVVAGERTDVSYFIERVSYNPFDVLVRAERPRKEVNRTSIEVAEADKVAAEAVDKAAATVDGGAGCLQALGARVAVEIMFVAIVHGSP